jgi:hypothetical protein
MPRLSYALVALFLAVAACDSTDSHLHDRPHEHEPDAVIISFETDFRMSDAAISGSVASVQYEVPDLTPRIVDGGVVLAFFRDQSTWTAMPFTYGVESPELPAVDYTVTLGYAFEDRLLEVFYEASTDEIDLGQLPDRRIKVVLLDAAVALGKNTDLTDWNQVRDLYGLTD